MRSWRFFEVLEAQFSLSRGHSLGGGGSTCLRIILFICCAVHATAGTGRDRLPLVTPESRHRGAWVPSRGCPSIHSIDPFPSPSPSDGSPDPRPRCPAPEGPQGQGGRRAERLPRLPEGKVHERAPCGQLHKEGLGLELEVSSFCCQHQLPSTWS